MKIVCNIHVLPNPQSSTAHYETWVTSEAFGVYVEYSKVQRLGKDMAGGGNGPGKGVAGGNTACD